MKIRVLFFGMLKDALARDSETLELPEMAHVHQLLQHYALQEPQIETLLSTLAVAVNQQYAQAAQILQDGDEVALLPPVSGGTAGEQEPSLFACIQDEPIFADPLVARLKRGEDGAVVVFDGIVRNQTRGRRTHYLVYEAYKVMALEQMRRILQDAKRQFSIRDAVVVHRLGRLEVGETSVLIAVASTHRAQAFDACRWIIDTLKKTVPIWKKEYFEDGAVWADGEPFPVEIMAVSRRQQ